MVYVVITSMTLKKNPIKRARFLIFATRRILQARDRALLAETNSVNGQFVTIVAWESCADMLAFHESWEANIRWSAQRFVQDVATDGIMYGFETDRLPTWEEAVDVLEAVKNGEFHSENGKIYAMKPLRMCIVQLRLRLMQPKDDNNYCFEPSELPQTGAPN